MIYIYIFQKYAQISMLACSFNSPKSASIASCSLPNLAVLSAGAPERPPATSCVAVATVGWDSMEISNWGLP